MVDPIGPRPVKPSEAVAVAPVVRAPVPQRTAQDQPRGAETIGVRTLAKELAARPPVDSDRVARIRKAVESGEFPIAPTTIADRLIALKFAWMAPDDAA